MAELGLGIVGVVGTINVCLRYGRTVVSKYKSFKDADNEISERFLTIEATWSRISQQLIFLQRLWDGLDAEHRDLQQCILLTFQSKLEVAILEVTRIEKQSLFDGNNAPSKRKSAKYSLFVRESLDRAIQDLQKWAAEFVATWWLILRMADETVDKSIDIELISNIKSRSFETARHIRDALQTEAVFAWLLLEGGDAEFCRTN
ncbi:hypothetical protein BDW62DRAFT_93737 [Aspergillus aurantiobrunneus]